MRESSIVKRSPPVKGTQNVARERENFANNNNNNNNDGQKQDIEPSLPVKRVVFRLGATVMRQARLTQDTDDEEEEEQRLVMDLEREEVVRRR